MERLRDWREETTWSQFLSRYGRMIHRVATRSGLRPHEADEVVQETALSVARAMPGFVYEPDRCSFEGWIRRMARLRIVDQVRRRGREERTGALGSAEAGASRPGPALGWEVLGETRWQEDAPEEAGEVPAADADVAWQEEWKQMVLERALDRLRSEVSPEHYQIFYMAVLEERDGADVARILDVSRAQVYVVRHRLMARLQREVEMARKEAASGVGLG